MLNAPSLDDSLESVSLGDSDNVDHLVGVENGINLHFLFKQVVAEINLLLYASSVDLNLEDVVLLLSHIGEQLHLGGTDGSHNGTVFSNSVERNFDGIFLLFVFLGVF